MLTPEEIEARDFLVSLRGYDREEVHDFLGQVADRVRELQDRIEELEADAAVSAQRTAEAVERAASQPQVVEPEPQAPVPTADTTMFAEIGRQTQRILEAAQEVAGQIRDQAQQEADRELEAARDQASQLIADAERRVEDTRRAVAELEEARGALAGDLLGVSRTIEQVLRDLAPDRVTTDSVREALAAEADGELAAQADSDAQPPAPGQAPAGTSPQAAAEVEDDEASAATRQASAGQAAAAPGQAEAAPAGAGGQAPTGEQAAEAAADGADPTVELSSAPTAELPREAGPQELRAAVLAALHPKLVRTINRGLQELHNHALNRVRRAPGRADLEALLPTEEQIGSLTELADDLLDQAYRAGTRSASSLAGRTLPEPAAPRDLDADFFGELVDRVHSGLAATLRTGLSAGEGRPSLSNRVGVVFGELKGPRAEELAASHLVHAYELGMLDAWSAGGVTSRRWVLGKEPRCPEGRCRHNDRTGALPIGQAFPSGHDVPPVHVGCTCTTLPSAES